MIVANCSSDIVLLRDIPVEAYARLIAVSLKIIVAALQATNRRLHAELTAARVAAEERGREAEERGERVRELEGQCEKMQVLIAKLEDDILKVRREREGKWKGRWGRTGQGMADDRRGGQGSRGKEGQGSSTGTGHLLVYCCVL